MIMEYLPPSRATGSSRGWAKLLLMHGYPGEYLLPVLAGVVVKEWDLMEDLSVDLTITDYGQIEPPEWVRNYQHGETEELAREPQAGGYGGLVELQGRVEYLWDFFYRYALRLDPECDPQDYTPGGDDDTFDYYPGAFEFLAGLAIDLDELDSVYVQNGGEPRKFTAAWRMVGLIRNLHHAKGPFREWEFEDYARPYAKAAGVEVDEPTTWQQK